MRFAGTKRAAGFIRPSCTAGSRSGALRSAEYQERAVHAQDYGLLSKQGVAVVHPYAVHEAATAEVAAPRRSGS
jgi:hypothetical protein